MTAKQEWQPDTAPAILRHKSQLSTLSVYRGKRRAVLSQFFMGIMEWVNVFLSTDLENKQPAKQTAMGNPSHCAASRLRIVLCSTTQPDTLRHSVLLSVTIRFVQLTKYVFLEHRSLSRTLCTYEYTTYDTPYLIWRLSFVTSSRYFGAIVGGQLSGVR